MGPRLCIWLILLSQSLLGQEIFTPEWTRLIHTSDYDFVYPQGLEIDSKGNVYITCTADDTIWIDGTPVIPGTGYDNNVIAKFNPAGELLWTRNYIDTYNNTSTWLRWIQINSKDELIVHGSSGGVIVYDGVYLSDDTDDTKYSFLHKIDTSGETLDFMLMDSIFIYECAIGPNDEISGIALNSGTDDGMFGQTITANVFMFQCTDSFTLNYLIEQPGAYSDPYISNTYPAYFQHIAADNAGNTFVTYIYDDTLHLNGETYLPHTYTVIYTDSFEIAEDSFEVYIDTVIYRSADGVLVKYDANGNAIWDCVIEGRNNQFFHTITVDEHGDVFTIGLFFAGDTVFIKDSSLIILPDMMPDTYRPYIVMHIDAEGNPVNYMFSEDSIFLYSELVVQDAFLYVPGHIYSDEENWDNAALGRYDMDLTLQQIGRASCAFTSPCASDGDLRILGVFDSSIYALGEYYERMVFGGDTLNTHLWDHGYFLTKFPYDFSETYVLPDSMLYEYAETMLYPIPTKETLYMSFSDQTESITDCIISNTLGQFWPITPERINLNNWQLDVHFLRAGAYFIRYTADGVTRSGTWIKM